VHHGGVKVCVGALQFGVVLRSALPVGAFQLVQGMDQIGKRIHTLDASTSRLEFLHTICAFGRASCSDSPSLAPRIPASGKTGAS